MKKTIRAICMTILVGCLFVSVGCGSNSTSKSTSSPTSNQEYKAYLASCHWNSLSENNVVVFVRRPKMKTGGVQVGGVDSYGGDPEYVFYRNRWQNMERYANVGVDVGAVKHALSPVASSDEVEAITLKENGAMWSAVDPDTSSLTLVVYKGRGGKSDVIRKIPPSSIL